MSSARKFAPTPLAEMRQPSSTTADQLPDASLYTSSVLSLLHGFSGSSTRRKSCPSFGFSGSEGPLPLTS